MRYRVDYRSGDKDLTSSLRKARRLADASRSGAEVFDLESMRRRGDTALSEEDVVYASLGRGEPTEGEAEYAAMAAEVDADQELRKWRAAEPGDTRFVVTHLEDETLVVGYDDKGDEVSRDRFQLATDAGAFIQGFREHQAMVAEADKLGVHPFELAMEREYEREQGERW